MTIPHHPVCLPCPAWYSSDMNVSMDLATTRFEQSAELFRALADPTRLAILDLLSDTPKCVCEIGDTVAIAPNLLSYHLKVLREAGLIVGDKRGRWVDYSIASGAWDKLRRAIPAEYGLLETAR